MALQDVEKDLQQRDSRLRNRQHQRTPYDVWAPDVEPAREDYTPSTWQKITDQLGVTRARALLIGGSVLVAVTVLMAIIVAVVFYQRGFFSRDRVTIAVTAPASITSTTLTEVVFTVHNDNRAALENVDIAVQFGSYFVPSDDQEVFHREGVGIGTLSVGTIAGGATHTVALAGHFNGPRGAIADVAGTVRFVPEGATARYEITERSATMITESPLTIDINAPRDVAAGNLLDIGIVVRNTSTEDMHDLALTVVLPQTFQLVNTVPSPNHGTVWVIPSVPAHGDTVVRLRGSVQGDVGAAQTFRATVHNGKDQSLVFAQSEYVPRMVQSPLTVVQSVEGREGIAYAGETLSYRITFHNTGGTPLRDAIVRVRLDERVLDLSQLRLVQNGDYQPEERTITWKASDVPELKLLAPNAQGSVAFSVPVVEQLPVENNKDFHYAVTTVASIDSPDVPSAIQENKTVLSNTLMVPIGAKVLPSVTVTRKDGAMPLKVGQTTTYDLTFSVGSVNNDLSQVRVTLPLPTHMTFRDASGSGVTFNERTNEVVWDIGTVTHGAGVVGPAPQMIVTLSIVPSIDQAGEVPLLVNNYTITGTDTFINKPFTLPQSGVEARVADHDYTNNVVTE